MKSESAHWLNFLKNVWNYRPQLQICILMVGELRAIGNCILPKLPIAQNLHTIERKLVPEVICISTVFTNNFQSVDCMLFLRHFTTIFRELCTHLYIRLISSKTTIEKNDTIPYTLCITHDCVTSQPLSH